MNKDFPRIITMLRKEKKLSQKQVSADLYISQALLSHYEKGIRECGLDFVLRVADYYNVSCDFLLGRTPERSGAMLSFDDIPDGSDESESNTSAAGALLPLLNKKILSNSLTIIFDLLIRTNSKQLTADISNYLMLAEYKVFRTLYSSNPSNHQSMFAISQGVYQGYCDAFMGIYATKFESATNHGNKTEYLSRLTELESSSEKISEDYPKLASSLFNLIQHSESKIKTRSR